MFQDLSSISPKLENLTNVTNAPTILPSKAYLRSQSYHFALTQGQQTESISLGYVFRFVERVLLSRLLLSSVPLLKNRNDIIAASNNTEDE